jgi:hypothetical protein
MIMITQKERHNILDNHTYFDESTLCYWYNKINKRLDYLQPLLNELKLKKMDLSIVSRELAQEVFEITELKKILEMYKTIK